MLQIEARKEAGEQARAIVAFPNVFRTVLQASVADQKIVAAACQVERVDSGDAADGEFGRHRVIFAAPPGAIDGDASGSKAIDGGECEAFRFAVVPAQPEKMPMSFVSSCSRLMPKPYFRVPLRRVVGHHRSAAIQFRQPDRLAHNSPRWHD